MHQDRCLNLLLTSSALLKCQQLSYFGFSTVNTSVQPGDKDLAFRRCFWSLSQVLDAADVFATRLHPGRGAL